MKSCLMVLFALLLAVAPIGQAHADPNVDLAEKIVQMVEQLATVISRNASSCDAMGNALEQYVQANADFIQQAKAAWNQLSDSQKKALWTRFQGRVNAAMAKINPGVMRCSDNPKVSAAINQAKVL